MNPLKTLSARLGDKWREREKQELAFSILRCEIETQYETRIADDLETVASILDRRLIAKDN